ncbi:AraC family transcriptional regulator [Vibrio sp. SCSIO 43136]|uniref:AraC family transcriptional regulator n=1 Tax=Vibrio sp. SCSIO 43136 TaxID=2819101 RepID=UPI0020762280|nr:AraC family transcriptional regulator [Vibrio sp. SCSIO 43136]USD64451.1 AraC family transcriptional regulator [Vibrio sp. SCSIO 43136]
MEQSQTKKIIAQYQPTAHRFELGNLDVLLLLATLMDKGTDTYSLLHQLGLELPTRKSHHQKMTFADKLSLFSAALEIFPNQGLGLQIGTQAQLKQFGVLGYVLLSSQNVEQAIKAGLGNLQLNGPLFSITVEQHEQCVSIRLDNQLELAALMPFCSEFFLSALLALFREMTGQSLPLQQVCFAYPEVSYHAMYDEHFGCPISFDAKVTAIEFDSDILYKPLATHDPRLLEGCLASCQSIRQALSTSFHLDQQVLASLYRSPLPLPDILTTSHLFGMSPRTLSRNLAKRSTSYTQLVSKVKTELAREMLLNTQLSVEEIADSLGYSDSSNFRRAFKRCTNKTPIQIRCPMSS